MDPTDQSESQNLSGWQRFRALVEKESSFFRVHVAAFVLVPLIFSAIFWGCNGRFHVSFLDSLFLCYSAMTVTGLSTVNLSTITVWQQVILYLLMMFGDFTIVSWCMVLVRKHYFKTHCEYIVAKSKPKRPNTMLYRSRTALVNAISSPIKSRRVADDTEIESNGHMSAPGLKITNASPSATLLFGNGDPEKLQAGEQDKETFFDESQVLSSSPEMASVNLSPINEDAPGLTSSPEAMSVVLPPTTPTTHGVEFAASTSITPSMRQRAFQRQMTSFGDRLTPHRSATILTNRARQNTLYPNATPERRYMGLGGFPGPFELSKRLFNRAAPKAARKLERKMTMPSVQTLEQEKHGWLNFSGLTVGRNSDFHTETLSDDQLEQIGGTEYRALRLLSYLVPAYFVITQLICFILFAPWISTTSTYDDVFANQPRIVNKTWFSFFQTMSAYTGGGLSLVDLGMIPFQNAYLMIFALAFVILAGNHALPLFLRLTIWIASKFYDDNSVEGATLEFLLEHPRRCFVYLFPSHQTWFLVICLVFFSIVEWIAFEVLNIGLPVYEDLSAGVKTVSGLFQGLAARASGFSIVPTANLAPAVQFLYVVMMYIAVYPIALSIRSTNVYEEKSLGVFEAPPDEEDEEPTDLNKLDRNERVGRYLGWHLRRQMSVDIWWLVWGVFLVTIIERGNIMDENKKWFDLFRVLFELVSAFGGIGLTLGFPDDNFSFVGAMKPLSKLVVIVIMIRGRHRGLPVAVDRAVLLPQEMVPQTATIDPKPPTVNREKSLATSPLPRRNTQNGLVSDV